MTSRQPCWCFQTIERRPCWCTQVNKVSDHVSENNTVIGFANKAIHMRVRPWSQSGEGGVGGGMIGGGTLFTRRYVLYIDLKITGLLFLPMTFYTLVIEGSLQFTCLKFLD